jgi:hypothetical protein
MLPFPSQAAEERRDSNVKMEGHVNGIWDQIRHVENSLSQRLTLAETSQVCVGRGGRHSCQQRC